MHHAGCKRYACLFTLLWEMSYSQSLMTLILLRFTHLLHSQRARSLICWAKTTQLEGRHFMCKFMQALTSYLHERTNHQPKWQAVRFICLLYRADTTRNYQVVRIISPDSLENSLKNLCAQSLHLDFTAQGSKLRFITQAFATLNLDFRSCLPHYLAI